MTEKLWLIQPRYSGERSRDFWQMVNHDVSEGDEDRLYALGVALQNLEHQVLKDLNESLAAPPDQEGK